MRNLISGAQYIQDHVIHFYHLHALDWVDVTGALVADPAKTADLAQSISPWPLSSKAYFTEVQARVKALVDSGQLSIFTNGYWGHPAYKLPPEADLMAVAHYIEALSWQRDVIRMHAVLGGKNPHPQTFLVGGIAAPVDPNSPNVINPERMNLMASLLPTMRRFVEEVYLPDVKAVASFYPEWFGYGAGHRNYLSYGGFPTAPSTTRPCTRSREGSSSTATSPRSTRWTRRRSPRRSPTATTSTRAARTPRSTRSTASPTRSTRAPRHRTRSWTPPASTRG
jgi:Ni,Fe-hydrogenase I large subunit